MPVRPEEKIRCSFCGKNQDQVRKMIAGSNGVYICDECIELCSEILEEELGNEEEERPDFSGINLLKPKEIKEFLDAGVDMVLCTGGMSVDPDDKTPLAIKNAGVNVVTYGAPVLPGAMFLLSYTDDGRPVCGLPGCVMYAKRTIFDLVLPYLAAGVPVTREQIAAYGEGGLCLNCKVCTWPNCGFGKGV